LTPASGKLPFDGNVSDAHDLDVLVVRKLLTDGSFGEESLTAHGAHGRQREFFRHSQHMDGIVTTARPKVGRYGQRTDENESG
jgi:hypothetical protein